MRFLKHAVFTCAFVACVFGTSAHVASHADAASTGVSSARAHAPNSERPSGPFVAFDAVRTGGTLVFDGGVPDQVDGNEMTDWLQAEDFALTSAANLTSVRFWTFEDVSDPWAGVCEYFIYADASGQPGALLDSGTLVLVSRVLTGNTLFGYEEKEYVFDFPTPVALPAGVFWLGLHMSTVCNVRDDIYWSSTASTFGASGHESSDCSATSWLNNSQQHAFQLYDKSGTCPPPDAPYGPTPANGATNVPTDQVLSWNKACDEFVNGGFESGDFAGWTTFTTPGLTPLNDWAVVTGGGFFANGAPFEGTFYSTNGFDGDGGLVHEIWQEVCIPADATSAVLAWEAREQWDMVGSLPREFEIEFQPVGGGPSLGTFPLQSLPPNSNGDTGYVNYSGDLVSIIPAVIGTTTRIVWRQTVPETFTGPAQHDFDNARITIATPLTDGHGPNGTHDRATTNPRGFTATPVGVAPARKAHSDELFAQRVAMYEAVQRGEFASVKDALAHAAANTLSALRVSAANAPAGPVVPIASLRTGGLVFDGGQPDLGGGNEMTNWNQAEDFVLSANTDLESVRFWTIEADPALWTGVCEFQIYDDASGVPGTLLHSGALNLVSRVPTGNTVAGLIEMEHVFDFPSVISLPSGGYWIALHMSAACNVRDDIYWETTSNGFGSLGREQFTCVDPWNDNGVQHAFELYGKAVSSDCCQEVYALATGVPGTSGSNGPASLYRINTTTGAATLVGPTGFNHVVSLDWGPDNFLYASQHDGNTVNLLRINPATGAAGVVGQISDGTEFDRVPDISFNANGELYGYTDAGFEGVITIDHTNASYNIVGSSGFFGGGNGMSFLNDGRLVGTPYDTQCLVEYNVGTGAGMCLPGTAGNVPNVVRALDVCPATGALWGSWFDHPAFSGSGASFLVVLDLGTGAPSTVIPTIDGMTGIAFAPCDDPCPVTYDVYVDTINPPTTLACSGVSSPLECDPGLLQHCTTYYWQVVANSPGGTTAGPVWSFTTGSPACPGDTNGDGVVDFTDFSTVLAQYGQFGAGLSGDLNCDGVVDFADFSAVLAAYGTFCP